MGKHRPDNRLNQIKGDPCVIVNCQTPRLLGVKPKRKVYRTHSRYPGGLRTLTFFQQLEKDWKKPITSAIRGMLPKNKLRDQRMEELVHLYPTQLHDKAFLPQILPPAGHDEEAMFGIPPPSEDGKPPEDFVIVHASHPEAERPPMIKHLPYKPDPALTEPVLDPDMTSFRQSMLGMNKIEAKAQRKLEAKIDRIMKRYKEWDYELGKYE